MSHSHVTNRSSLVNKVAVVTGGGRGIGRALARALKDAGALVAIGDYDLESAVKVAKELGEGSVGLSLDVTKPDSFNAFFDAVEENLGPIDILINNAGVMLLGILEEEPEEVTERQLATNLFGVIYGTKAAIQRMRPRGTGHIVNISSIAGRIGFAGGSTYSASKHAVYGLSVAVKGELEGSGIEISVVMPTLANTRLAAGVRTPSGFSLLPPEEIARETLDALKSPRFEVYVPKRLGAMVSLGYTLPFGAREKMLHSTGWDRSLLDVDPDLRRTYETQARREQQK
jgi:NAD(P)-dependent dehydrogenase (short-subunit alcohol dehydrogenase family)